MYFQKWRQYVTRLYLNYIRLGLTIANFKNVAESREAEISPKYENFMIGSHYILSLLDARTLVTSTCTEASIHSPLQRTNRTTTSLEFQC